MAFDPDAYLAGKPQAASQGFDPDAYVAADRPPSYLDLSGAAAAPFDVNQAIAETLSTPPRKPEMPGDTPRLVAPESPLRREISTDAARASAERAETPEQQATRRYEGFLAGTQEAVPFFPRIRGAVAGRVAEGAAALRALAGKERENTEFARMQAAYLERKHAGRQIEKAASRAPVEAVMGNIALGVATPELGPLKLAGKTSGVARTLDSAAIGSAYGASAADRPGATGKELLAGAAAGAPIGAAGGLMGEGLRAAVRGSSGRENAAFIREIARTEGGEGAQALLAKNKVGLAKAYEDVIAQRMDPEIRKAVKMPEGKGIQILQKKIEPYRAENAKLYPELDKLAEQFPTPPKEFSGETGLRGTVGRWSPEGENTEIVRAKKEIKFPKEAEKGTVAKWGPGGERIKVDPIPGPAKPLPFGPEPPKRAGLMNTSRLDLLLKDAQEQVGYDANAARLIEQLRSDLKEHVVPHVLKGKTEMTTAQFRGWLTAAQGVAENTPGGLNWTNSYEAKQAAKNQAARIFNEYLDSIGAPEIVAKIRANNDKMSPVLRIMDAVETKAGSEKLQRMGLGKVMEEQGRSLERSAMYAAAMSGHPITAAGLLVKPYAEKGITKGLRWMNREVLEPMQLAAENGATVAQLARFGAERGLPQATANYFAQKFGEKFVEKVRESAKPEPESPKRMPLDPVFLGDGGGK